MARTSGSTSINLAVNTSKGERSLRDFSQKMDRFAHGHRGSVRNMESSWGRFGRKIDDSALGFTRLGRQASTFFSLFSQGTGAAIGGIGGVVAGIATITATINVAQTAWQKFASLDTLRRRSGAAAIGLGGTAEARLDRATGIGRGIAEEYGISEKHVQAALKDILGLNLGSWEEASELLEIAAKEWWYSGADMSRTAATMKGQATLWERDLNEIADEMAATVQISGSGTTMQNLGRAQGFYMPAASQAEVSSSFANALYATLTQLGLNPERSGTATAAVFRELVDTTKGLGKLIKDRTGLAPGDVDETTLIRILGEMYRDLDITELSGAAETRAGLVAFDDTTMMQGFFEDLARGSGGRFDEVTGEVLDTSERKLNQWKVALDDAWNEIGKTLVESEGFNDMIDMLKQTIPEAAKFAAGALTTLSTAISSGWEFVSGIMEKFGFGGGGEELRDNTAAEQFLYEFANAMPAAIKDSWEGQAHVLNLALQPGVQESGFGGFLDEFSTRPGRENLTATGFLDEIGVEDWMKLFEGSGLAFDELREMAPAHSVEPEFEVALLEYALRTAKATEEGAEAGKETANHTDPDNPANCPPASVSGSSYGTLDVLKVR